MSRLVIAKMLDKRAQSTLTLKIRFVRNLSLLDVTRISLEIVIFNPKEIKEYYI